MGSSLEALDLCWGSPEPPGAATEGAAAAVATSSTRAGTERCAGAFCPSTGAAPDPSPPESPIEGRSYASAYRAASAGVSARVAAAPLDGAVALPPELERIFRSIDDAYQRQARALVLLSVVLALVNVGLILQVRALRVHVVRRRGRRR